ncbi:MAG: 23S rRNA pseudouridine(2604) synthase RluF [Bacteroidetes bacterium]|nr:23S rRNA pseudouridine(2604) synthase RluF [Bacteroidota bacterium]
MDTSLNKYISESGFCSRREADVYIEQLRVTINGREAHKGNRVKDGDVVLIDGEPIRKKHARNKSNAVYIALNKPKGITCTTDLKDKTNIVDFVNYKSRIFPVGRLDKRSEGLIFLTNDGDIVNKILRAGNNHEKEYIVTVDQPLTAEFIQKMRAGVRIAHGVITKSCFVKQEGADRFRIILIQGLNRQIRRMCEVLGYQVQTLKRIRIMHITLSNLPPGKWRYFTTPEIETMQNLVAGSSKTADGDNGMDE